MTFLQKLSHQVHYAIHWRLHDFHSHSISNLNQSAKTLILIADRRVISCMLKASIKADYEAHKAIILEARQKRGNKQ